MKNPLAIYSIPILGLKQSRYSFDFQLDASFFSAFEDSEIKEGKVNVNIELERKTGHLEFYFELEGVIKTICDRCTSDIYLPIDGNAKLIAKFSEFPQEDEDEIIYIHPETSEINLAQYIYEYVTLALPVRKTYDCENDETPPCDFDVLKHLEENEREDSVDDEVDKTEKSNTWEILKNWNKN